MSQAWTEIYGASDDLIEVEGAITGEHGAIGATEDEPVLVIVSDGTLLSIHYGKQKRGIWCVALVREGELFDRIEQCDDEDAGRYSDSAFFRPGVTWAYAANDWAEIN